MFRVLPKFILVAKPGTSYIKSIATSTSSENALTDHESNVGRQYNATLWFKVTEQANL